MFSPGKHRVIAAVVVALLIVPLVAGAYLAFRAPETVPALPPPVDRDLDVILQGDTLHALTAYTSTSYFLYRGEPFGYEYELLLAFADDHDLVLRMHVVHRDSLLPMLNRGAGDVAAARLVPMGDDTLHVAYTAALYRTRPVIVQRDGVPDGTAVADSARGTPLPAPFEIAARPVRRPEDLAGDSVHIPANSPYVDLLVELEDELTGDITVVEVDTASESLIRQVARGEVGLTVAQQNVAELEESFFTNLAVTPAMGRPHDVAWAVRANARRLREAFDGWLDASQQSGRFNTLYRTYFVDRQGFRERVDSRYLTAETGTLSDYDDLLRGAALEIGWDWRLLASQAFQESRFDPRARSWAGAAGLLQLMPRTAEAYGVTDPYDPADNVAGAVRFLAWLEDYWKDTIPDPEERLKFVLASYNTGQGHVEDARRLAEKHGADNTAWAPVAYWLLRKSRQEVFSDPVVRYGFCRGLEPVNYVGHVLDRYRHYREFVRDGAQIGPSTQATRRPAPAG